nr:hypothetical protein [Desulfobulbaceae bacterium]
MNCWEYKNYKWTDSCPAHPDHGDCCIVKTGTLCCADHDLINKMMSGKKCNFYNSEHFNNERAISIIDTLN